MKEQKVRYEDLSHPTLFHELLHSKLPPSEKSVQRLGDEARTIVNAGSETVAWTLTVAVYHLLANPQILRHLKTELAEAILDPEASTSLTALEQLPYLVALVKEALRLSYGVASRLARVPHEPLQFENWVIPAGTPVSMTSPLLHHDESIFPDSKEFKPERWIEDPRLDRYMVSFSRGSRQCVGMHLAYAEIYLWLSGVFRRFGSKEVRFEDDEGVIELVDTVVEDVELAADCFIPVAKKGSKGVRIRVLP
jgi:cytochrome P450